MLVLSPPPPPPSPLSSGGVKRPDYIWPSYKFSDLISAQQEVVR